MFRAGDRVGVAVSGGADSVFLLHALRELAPCWNLRLSVVHIEHGIRGEASLADARFVADLAKSFGLTLHLHRADVPSLDDNLEQAARRVRTEYYRELIESSCLDRIATGHTRSDQAETVLYRLIRGSGTAGLAGILPVAEPGVVRPLLELTRPEIQDWLAERSISWREDLTNQDRSYARNRIRHEVLPLLRESFNPRVDDVLANVAQVAQDEEAYWKDAVEQAVGMPGGQPLIVPISTLTTVPTALARRLVRHYMLSVRGDLRQIDFAHVERVLEMARSSEGHDRAQFPGLDVFRSFDWLRFAKLAIGPPPERDYAYPVNAPGFLELPGGGSRITLQIQEKTSYGELCVTLENELDWQRVCSSGDAASKLELRNWRPGDKYRRFGRPQEEKIKTMFQESRVPLWERRHWPIITYNGVILWTRRFGAAADFAAGTATRVVLRIEESVSEPRIAPRAGTSNI